jgi:argininosuccinate synthase
MTMRRIVLAYSGDSDASAAVGWLAATYGAEVVAVTLDLGQRVALEEVRDRALTGGAVRAHVLDVRDEFVHDFVLPALKAEALDHDGCPTSADLSGPLIGQKLVEIAAIEQADAVAYGFAGTTSRPSRLDVAVRGLNPSLSVIGPLHDVTRSAGSAVAHADDLWAARSAPPSADVNLWGRVVEWRSADAEWTEPPESIYTLTKRPAECPHEPAFVELTFEAGMPTAVNGVTMPFVELIASLVTIAGAHGVGRVARVKKSASGSEWRVVWEAPAAVVLQAAHGELQRMVTSSEASRFMRLVSIEYGDVIDRGLWFSPLREALDACVDRIQQRVTGTIRLRLFKGGCHVVLATALAGTRGWQTSTVVPQEMTHGRRSGIQD